MPDPLLGRQVRGRTYPRRFNQQIDSLPSSCSHVCFPFCFRLYRDRGGKWESRLLWRDFQGAVERGCFWLFHAFHSPGRPTWSCWVAGTWVWKCAIPCKGSAAASAWLKKADLMKLSFPKTPFSHIRRASKMSRCSCSCEADLDKNPGALARVAQARGDPPAFGRRTCLAPECY